RFSAELERLDQSAATLARLEKTVAEAETAYRTAAAALSLERHGAAGVLDAAVVAELPPLKLERAAFITRVTSDPASAGPDGYD
ncbi:hypothetical protein NL388_33545, partial [Klebsiella pneumoniae]|nr:hypothetical protein [Klebsiella pneumoniae]